MPINMPVFYIPSYDEATQRSIERFTRATAEISIRLGELRALQGSWWDRSYFDDQYLERLKFPITVTFLANLYRPIEQRIIIDNLWDLAGFAVITQRIYDYRERLSNVYSIHTAEGWVEVEMDPNLDVGEFVAILRHVEGLNRQAKRRAKREFIEKNPALTLM